MSTYYYLRCNDCAVTEDSISINHGEETLQAMILFAAVVRDWYRHALWSDVTVKIDYEYVPLDFLCEHIDHDLMIWDEYGREYPLPWRANVRDKSRPASATASATGTDADARTETKG